jgi:hypothetical protein
MMVLANHPGLQNTALLVLAGASQTFGIFKRVRLSGIEAQLRGNPSAVKLGKPVEIVFRRRREDVLHRLQVVAAEQLPHFHAFAA